MARRLKKGGAVPGTGLTAVNLGDPLRRQLERVCRRNGVSLSDYIRASLERDIARERFWKYQGLRYLIQTVRMALGGDFVKTLGFPAPKRRELNWNLQELLRLVEQKAEEEFAATLPPGEREKRYGEADASGRQTKGVFERPEGSPHWDFSIPEVERILDAL